MRIQEEHLITMALRSSKVQKALANKSIKRIVCIQKGNKCLINFVTVEP